MNNWMTRYKRVGISAEAAYRAEVQLKDELTRVRDYVKGRPHLQVRLYLDHHHINQKVVRADGKTWFVSSATEVNPWTSDYEEFMKWRFEDGYLIVQEEEFGGKFEKPNLKRLTLVKANRVRLIQVVEPERILHDVVNPKVM